MTPAEVMEWADAISHVCVGALAVVGLAGVLAFAGWTVFQEVR